MESACVTKLPKSCVHVPFFIGINCVSNIIIWAHLHSQVFLAHEPAAYVSGGHFSLIKAGSEEKVSFEELHQSAAKYSQNVAESVSRGDSDSSDEVC